MKSKTQIIKDVMIGYPCYDGKALVQAMNAINYSLFNPAICVEKVQFMNGDSLVSRARNKVTGYFLSSDCEYLMFIDSDITFAPEQINMLRAQEKGVIGGIYLKKTLPYQPVSNSFIEQEGNLQVMREIGTGFMMIHRSVFEKIREKFPERNFKRENDEPELKSGYYDYFGVGVVNGRYLSEDYYFCHLAREAGFKIYYDPSIIVTHHGQTQYPMEDVKLFEGATALLWHYNLEAEMDEKILENLYSALMHQAKHRGVELNPKNTNLEAENGK